MGGSGDNEPHCLSVLPYASLHGVSTYQLLVLVALFAGLARGCRSKALHAAEGNELRFYAGSLLHLLAQVKRRLLDLQEGLTKRQC
jgi:hypothetical protein